MTLTHEKHSTMCTLLQDDVALYYSKFYVYTLYDSLPVRPPQQSPQSAKPVRNRVRPELLCVLSLPQSTMSTPRLSQFVFASAAHVNDAEA